MMDGEIENTSASNANDQVFSSLGDRTSAARNDSMN